jgi:hypothetical protein
MTPADLQSLADNWLARSTACGNNGEREQARVLLDCARAITVKAPEPPVEAAKAPEPTPEPSKAPKGTFMPGAVDRGGKPFTDRD